jgi:hypothetical protein
VPVLRIQSEAQIHVTCAATTVGRCACVTLEWTRDRPGCGTNIRERKKMEISVSVSVFDFANRCTTILVYISDCCNCIINPKLFPTRISLHRGGTPKRYDSFVQCHACLF